MEHEDNAQFENYLQNSQNRMETLHHHASSGVGVGIGIAGDCVGDNDAGEIVGAANIGQKYGGEHDDEEESKYIKEVQQSEKQQQQQQQQQQQHQELFGDGSPYSLVGGGDASDAVLLGNTKVEGNGFDSFLVANGGSSGVIGGGSVGGYDFGFGSSNGNSGNIDMYLHGNGHEQSSAVDGHNVAVGHGHTGIFGEEDVDVLKHDGDFSTKSNTATSTGEALAEAMAAASAALVENVLQVEMKIEQQLQPEHQQPQQQDEEEEPSSVATTYGTSSLSENPTPLEQEEVPVIASVDVAQQPASQDFHFSGFDNKENADPADLENSAPSFCSDLHSELNPNAVEFVPSFGSQPTSPTEESAPAFGTPHPSAVARHLLDEDDLVAESPRKGRVSDMDAITLPAENEFENEAHKRPHSVEQDEDLFGIEPHNEIIQQHIQDQQHQLLFENGKAGNEDCLDYQRQSPASFIDHGPETCVDNDSMAVPIDDDVMNKSIYVEQTGTSSTTPIEDILNSVQVLPVESDSHNNSFIEAEAEEGRPIDLLLAAETVTAADKELLHVEEKEHVSHSPSTEELQMNLRNDVHGSNKDIPQLPIDPLDSAANMQESFYLEHTSADAQSSLQNDLPSIGDQSILMDTSLPQDMNASLLHDDEDANVTYSRATSQQLTPEVAAVIDLTTSPISSTEEKHLVEDTKEDQQTAPTDEVHEYAERMDELMLSAQSDLVGALPQAEQAAHFAATNDNNFEQFDPFANENQQLAADESAFAAYKAEQQPIDVNFFAQEEEQQQEQQQQQQKSHEFEIAQGQEQQKQQQLYDNEEAFLQQHDQHQQSFAAEEPLPDAAAAAIAGLHDNITESNNFSADHGIPTANIDFAEPQVTEETLAPVETAPAVPKPATEAEPTPAPVVDEKSPIAVDIAVAGAAAAVAATAAVAAVATDKVSPKAKSTTAAGAAAKKPLAAKAGSAAGAKPKVGAATPSTSAVTKKPSETIKKSTASTTSSAVRATAASAAATARPRTAPAAAAAKTAAAAKPATTTTGAAAAAATRKSLSTNLAAKPSAARLTTRPATAPAAGAKAATAARTASTTTTTATARRTPTAAAAAATARKPATNGTAAAKARSTATATGAGAGPASKPATLSVTGSTASATARPKLSSPRATLSSQLRKAAPAAGAAGSGAKSPIKPPTAANGGLTKTTTSTLTSRTKPAAGSSTHGTTTTTTTTTTITKTFTARPAPKTTHISVGSTLSATRRSPAGATAAGGTAARKLSPLKSSSMNTNTNSKSPTSKLSTSPLKAKAKEPVKSPNSSALKSKTVNKQPTAAVGGAKVANGGGAEAAESTMPQEAEQQPPTVVNGNGIHNEPAESNVLPVAAAAAAEGHAQQAADVAILDF